MWRRSIIILALIFLEWAGSAWADGTQYNGTCSAMSWTANTEVDLAGYQLYDRVSLSATPTLIATYGIQITSVTCASLGFNPGQHYLSLRAFDTSGNESPATTDQPFVIIVTNQVSDLRVTVINATDMTLTWTEVDNGLGAPATYDVRLATPTIDWGTAPSVTSGTCSTPVAGTTIGASKSCTVTGLATTTAYQFRIVPYRNTLGLDAVFGPLSNIADGTTGGTPPVSGRTTIASVDFTQANGALVSPWMHGYTSSQNATVVSNAVRPSAGGGSQAVEVYNVTTPNDQWARVFIQTIQGAGTVQAYARVRMAETPTFSGYTCGAYRNDGSVRSKITRRTAGALTQLASENTTTWASGDALDCSVQGSTITLSRISGGTTTVLLTVDDATYTSGKTGIGIYSTILGDGILDTFSMGTFTVAVVDACGCDNH